MTNLATPRQATRLAGLVGAALLLAAGQAGAHIGACGLETGMWAAPQEACRLADRPDETVMRFGENALIDWELGYYRFQGAHCTVFSDRLDGKRCTLRAECAYAGNRAFGEWDIEVETASELRFGTRPSSPIYHHCGVGAPR